MKKDFVRDYATAAFRLWAIRGCNTYEQEMERIEKRAEENAKDADSDKAVEFAQAELVKRVAELYDIMACDETFRLLEKQGKGIICSAVKEVYMIDPWREPKRDEIAKRVLRFAIDTPASERQVYRWLAEARNLFAALRGLRVDDSDDW